MSHYFFDSSGLVKRYVPEQGSQWTRATLDPKAGNTIHVSQITDVEMASAIARRVREGNISVQSAATIRRQILLDFFRQYTVIAIAPPITELAIDLLYQYPLRAYDATQLASALYVNRSLRQNNKAPLVFVSADKRLLAVAGSEGLQIEDPNTHP